MKHHPYAGLAARNFWRRFVADTAWRDLPLMDPPPFKLTAGHRLATAGSCFAQHISRYMVRAGLAPYIAEPPHPFLAGAEAESHATFSARYGNVYTARQGLELLRQALGTQAMVEDFALDDGRWFDLLRPGVLAAGWASRSEARADRAWHLQCVRTMFETADVFVFTLGLTECWQHAAGGHTYPVCPGTLRGDYQPQLHRFHNLRCDEVIEDLHALITEARAVNPALRFIFTVSPVPLVATQGPQNVLVASSHSKAVLRAAVGEVVAQHRDVAYFPSFEIVGHAASFGQYLASDLREVTERGVGHVMAHFLESFYGIDAATARPAAAASVEPAESAAAPSRVAECEEIYNEQGPSSPAALSPG